MTSALITSILRKATAALVALLLAVFMLLAVACGGGSAAPPTATAAPTASPTPAATTSPGPTATQPTPTPAESPTGSPTTPPPSPTATASPAPSPTAPASPTATPATTYTVQPGDTLFSIARRFGTTVDALATANNIDDPSQIRAGQVLVIPSGDGPITTPTPGTGSAEVIRKGPTTQRMVAFTFDAGADPGFTGQILDILKANGITASFGITGRWAEQNPDLMRRIVSEGHHLINHSYDHSSFTGLSTSSAPLTREQRWQQLDRTEAIVNSLTGASTKPYFRPPFGDYDSSVNADIYARGYRYNVMWTVDSFGWRRIAAAEIVERCLSLAEPGAIYIFHVGAASEDAAALPAIIDGLRDAGYAIGSVPQLLAP